MPHACRAKSWYEAWEAARRVRRVFRGGRIVDLAASHCSLGQLMLILDDTSLQAVAVDTIVPASARVAVLPCCHDLDRSDSGGLSGWMNDALAIDVMRARRLASAGYRIWTQVIPGEITPKNRLLIGASDDVPIGS